MLFCPLFAYTKNEHKVRTDLADRAFYKKMLSQG